MTNFTSKNSVLSWDSPVKSSKSDNLPQNSSNMLKYGICWPRLSIIDEIYKFSMKTDVFSRNGVPPEQKCYLIMLITLRKLIGFAQNKSHSIAFVSLYEYIPRTCVFRRNNELYIENPVFSWNLQFKSSKSGNLSQNTANMPNYRIFWPRLSIIVEI